MRLLAALLLSIVCLSASVPPTSRALPHDAYIWQRVWTPAVHSAAAQSSDLIRSWRILVAETDRHGRWTGVSVPWSEVRKPAVAVIRIDGRLEEARIPALLDRIVAVAEGRPITGIEIDYDCPTSKLAAYAAFVTELRRRLPSPLALSITALPTWMGSSQLEAVAAPLDEIVLQVHAIEDPRQGLFDAARAEGWVREFGRRVRKPFRVALPAYDVAVTWRADGRLASVEAEVPLLKNDGAETVRAVPEEVMAMLRTLERSAPAHMKGVVWFRLPTESDRRAWSLSTWRGVITGHLPPARVSASLVATERPDLWTVTLVNQGGRDVAMPREVRLDERCEIADGANGYRLRPSGSGAPVLEAVSGGTLRAETSRTIGWARCKEPKRALHVGE